MTRLNETTFRAMANDPAEFRLRVKIDTDKGPVRFERVCEEWQRADFEALDPAWLRVAKPNSDEAPRRAWIERPRGHSKTSEVALMVAWALAFSRRRLKGYVAAADKDQADLLRAAMVRLVALNPWLGDLLTVMATKVRNPHTGSELEILTSDAPTSYGLNPDFVVVDEVTHHAKRDLWDSLFSSAAKRGHCLLVSILNAGWRDTWQWPLREAVRTDAAWIFSRLEGPAASWITSATLAEQERLLPRAAYRRLWLNQWADGSGDAIDAQAIDDATTLVGPLENPEPGWVYVAGLDLGLTRDSSALAIVGRHVGWTERIPVDRPQRFIHRTIAAAQELGLLESHNLGDDVRLVHHAATYRTRVARTELWRPTPGRMVQLPEVTARVAELAKLFGLARIAFDVWQGQHMGQLLQAEGLPMLPVQFGQTTLPAMAAEMLSAFNDRTVELYPDADLLADLRKLRVIEKSYGLRLESPRDSRGHGDVATALSLALLAAKDFSAPVGPPRIRRPLICWPEAA
jgi:phage terminase large subunit-like protein